jgi:hypothetical protein
LADESLLGRRQTLIREKPTESASLRIHLHLIVALFSDSRRFVSQSGSGGVGNANVTVQGNVLEVRPAEWGVGGYEFVLAHHLVVGPLAIPGGFCVLVVRSQS